MNLRKCLLIAALAVSPLATAEQASAQCGAGYGGWGFGAFAGVGDMYRVLADNHVPYYAAFPPVYYSAPVPRTYGYSPFAYLPTQLTPEIEVTPVAIDNPYVKALPANVIEESEGPSLDQTTQDEHIHAPLVVMNPFVSPNSDRTAGPVVNATYLH